MYMYVWVSGGKKCSFLGKLGVLCFVNSVLRFALSLYYRRYSEVMTKKIHYFKFTMFAKTSCSKFSFSRTPIGLIVTRGEGHKTF